MLARNAESLFWIGRYVERADGTARIVDVLRLQLLELRLLAVAEALDDWIARLGPTAVSVERVFAQDNLRSVIGVAQVMGVVMVAGARAGLEVAQHTPSEAKAAVTGSDTSANALFATLQQAAGVIPAVWASNFSLGVAVLAELVERAAAATGRTVDLLARQQAVARR